MGSLYSKPKLPQQTVVQAAPVIAPVAAAPVTVSENNDAAKIEASIKKARRLPETIRTSYRGVLETGAWVPQRKNLLGE